VNHTAQACRSCRFWSSRLHSIDICRIAAARIQAGTIVSEHPARHSVQPCNDIFQALGVSLTTAEQGTNVWIRVQGACKVRVATLDGFVSP
jgi:hypothetical protein